MDCRQSSRNSAAAARIVEVVGLGSLDCSAQVFEHSGEVFLELALRCPELLYLRELVVQETPDETVKLAWTGHVHTHRLFPVLDQDGGLRVLEDDVAARIAPIELSLDLGVEVVVCVLRFPVPARHAQRVLDSAVGNYTGQRGEFRHKRQILTMVTAVVGKAVLKRGPDVELVIGAPELDQLFELGTIALNVWVTGHGCFIIAGRGRLSDSVRPYTEMFWESGPRCTPTTPPPALPPGASLSCPCPGRSAGDMRCLRRRP